MHIRKLRNKWQCIVRIKNIALAQSFISKADARRWGNKQEAQIRLGNYSDDSNLTNLHLRVVLKFNFHCDFFCHLNSSLMMFSKFDFLGIHPSKTFALL